jgi:hypothetical protein
MANFKVRRAIVVGARPVRQRQGVEVRAGGEPDVDRRHTDTRAIVTGAGSGIGRGAAAWPPGAAVACLDVKDYDERRRASPTVVMRGLRV